MPSFLAYRPGLMSHLGSILIPIAPFWVNFRSEDAILEQNFAPDPMGWVPGPKSWPQGPMGAHGGPWGPKGAHGGPWGPWGAQGGPKKLFYFDKAGLHYNPLKIVCKLDL